MLLDYSFSSQFLRKKRRSSWTGSLFKLMNMVSRSASTLWRPRAPIVTDILKGRLRTKKDALPISSVLDSMIKTPIIGCGPLRPFWKSVKARSRNVWTIDCWPWKINSVAWQLNTIFESPRSPRQSSEKNYSSPPKCRITHLILDGNGIEFDQIVQQCTCHIFNVFQCIWTISQ